MPHSALQLREVGLKVNNQKTAFIVSGIEPPKQALDEKIGPH